MTPHHAPGCRRDDSLCRPCSCGVDDQRQLYTCPKCHQGYLTLERGSHVCIDQKPIFIPRAIAVDVPSELAKGRQWWPHD